MSACECDLTYFLPAFFSAGAPITFLNALEKFLWLAKSS